MAYKGDVKKRLEGLPTVGSGEVRLRDPKRTGTVTVREYWDADSGEEKELLSKSGSPRVTKITNKKKYDFTNIEERLEFFHIKEHPIYSNGGNAIFECINIDEEADEEVHDRDMFADAIGIIRNLEGSELRDFARLLLANKRIPFGEKTSEGVLKKHMYDMADTDPERVLEEYEDENKEYKILIRKGLEQNVFVNTNGVYKMGVQIIGNSFDAAVLYLKENEDLIPSLRKDIG
jgi:hypothetical protein